MSALNKQLDQFKVESDSRPGKFYIVTETVSGVWECGCTGWTRHVPRKDCKHIRWVKCGGAVAVNPMLRAMEVAQKRAGV